MNQWVKFGNIFVKVRIWEIKVVSGGVGLFLGSYGSLGLGSSCFSSFISKKGFDFKKGVTGKNQVFVERVGLGKGFRVKKKAVWVINFVFYTSLKCKKKKNCLGRVKLVRVKL